MADRTCSNPDCGRVGQLRRGLCNRCRQRLANTGTLDAPQPVTHCPQDHEYTPENTYTDGVGKRHCKICRKAAGNRARKAKVWPKCSIETCPQTTKGGAKGWCASHYSRYRNYGDPLGGPPIREWRVPAEEQRRRRSEYSRAYHEEHREKLNAGRAERYRANPERERAAQYDWRARNPDAYLAQVTAARDRRRLVIDAAPELVERGKVIAEHGMVCHLCGEAIESMAVLELDHVIPLARGGTHAYANIRPSHRRCNRRKGASLPS